MDLGSIGTEREGSVQPHPKLRQLSSAKLSLSSPQNRTHIFIGYAVVQSHKVVPYWAGCVRPHHAMAVRNFKDALPVFGVVLFCT